MIIQNLNYYLEELENDLINELGLPIMIKDKQYQISPTEKHSFHCYIGEALTTLSDVSHDTLLQLVRENPHNNKIIEPSYSNLFKACVWLRDKLKPLYGQLASEIIFIHFIKEIELFDIDQKDYFDDFDCIFLDEAEITKETFKGTQYSSYGGTDTGHFMLSALLRIRLDLRTLSRVLFALSESPDPDVSFLFGKSIQPDIRYQIVQIDDKLCSIYGMKDIYSMTVFDVHQMLTQGIAVRKCKNCGKFFIPYSRSDTLYCSRPSPQDKKRTCRKYQSEKGWYKTNEVANLSKNVSSAKAMLVKRNPNTESYKQMLDYFKKEKKKWEAAVKAGRKTEEEYTQWLIMIKKEKYWKPKFLEESLPE